MNIIGEEIRLIDIIVILKIRILVTETFRYDMEPDS